MKVENQYVDFFNENRSLIDRYSAPILNNKRDEAFERFKINGFSSKGSEHYSNIDFEKLFDSDFGLNVTQLKANVDLGSIFKCDVPNLSTNLCLLVNDTFVLPKDFSSTLPEGMIVMGLKEAAKAHPDLLESYYGASVFSDAESGIVDFNTAFAQDGFFVYVPDNVVLEKPIQLVNLLTSKVPLLVNRRLLMIVGRNSDVKILVCDHTVDQSIPFISTQVTEVFVDENSHFDLYDLEESSILTHRFSSTYVAQKAFSRVLINGTTLHNGRSRNNYKVDLLEEGADLDLSGMAICDRKQYVDNFSVIRHLAPNSNSNEQFKYVLDGEAQGVFSGLIFVDKNAQKTKAFQSNKNLCATKKAKMYTKPQLEIYADDVKCSHGATVGQLDANALFYLRARGVSETEARLLLMTAFTYDIVDRIKLEPLRDRLRNLVDRRFRGELSHCSGCSICD